MNAFSTNGMNDFAKKVSPEQNFLYNNVDQRIKIKIHLGTKLYDTLIDTGAACNGIRLDAWNELQTLYPQTPRTGVSLCSVDKKPVKTHGIVDLPIFGSVIPMHIMDVMSDEILLGASGLNALNATINIRKKQLNLNGKTIQGHGYDSTYQHVNSTEPVRPHEQADIIYKEYADLFAEEGTLSTTNIGEKFHIDTGDHKPIRQRPYKVPLEKKLIIEDEIRKMEKQGVISRSKNSHWSSPIVLTKKQDGTHRFCIDFRKINDITVSQENILPRIDEILDSLRGAKVFSVIDLRSAYWQCELDDESKPKTTFTSHIGEWQFNRLCFGLKQAPDFFQNIINKALGEHIGIRVTIYLDDLCVFSENESQHWHDLELVMKALRQANFKLKKSICHFFCKEVQLLGYIINDQGIRANPTKLEAIKRIPTPKTKKSVRSFLGACAYFSNLVVNYAHIAAPLFELTGTKKFTWEPRHQEAFERLKAQLMEDHVIAHPDTNKPYKLVTDASDLAIGGILLQKGDDGHDHPIHYISKVFNDQQKHWSAIERECFAILYCLRKLDTYLHGAKFEIHTDCKDLLSFMKGDKLQKNAKLRRWQHEITTYGAPLVHVPGSQNLFSDYLSRSNTNDVITLEELRKLHPEVDNEMKPLVIHMNTMSVTIEDAIANDNIPWYLDELSRDDIKIEQQKLPQWTDGELDQNEFTIIQGLLYSLKTPANQPSFPRLVLPPPFREKCINRAHSECGHAGFFKTNNNLMRSYLWPGQTRDVLKQLRACGPCILNSRKPKHHPPSRMPIAQGVGDIWSVDTIGPLPISNAGNRYCLVMIDHASAWAEVFPMRQKTAEEVFKIFHEQLIPRFSVPRILISDNGTEYAGNTLLRPYLTNLGVEYRTTSFYHPESNAICERFNASIKLLITKNCQNRPTEWETHLASALYAYRTSCHSSTGFSPFYLLYAMNPIKRVEEIFTTYTDPNIKLVDRVLEHKNALKAAAQNIMKTKEYDYNRLQVKSKDRNFKVGDHIALRSEVKRTFENQYDHGYIVSRIDGPLLWLIDYDGKQTKANANRCIRVPPNADLDGTIRRLTRAQHKKWIQEMAKSQEQPKPQKLDPIPEEDPEEIKAQQILDDVEVLREQDLQEELAKYEGPMTRRKSAMIKKLTELRAQSNNENADQTDRLDVEEAMDPQDVPQDTTPHPTPTPSPSQSRRQSTSQDNLLPTQDQLPPETDIADQPAPDTELQHTNEPGTAPHLEGDAEMAPRRRIKEFNPTAGGSNIPDDEQYMPTKEEEIEREKQFIKRSRKPSGTVPWEPHRVQPKTPKNSELERSRVVPKTPPTLTKFPKEQGPVRRSARLQNIQDKRYPPGSISAFYSIPELMSIKIIPQPHWTPLIRCEA